MLQRSGRALRRCLKGGDVDAAMDNYVKTTQDMVDEILGQLNAD